jgi:HlyD family secretion protein
VWIGVAIAVLSLGIAGGGWLLNGGQVRAADAALEAGDVVIVTRGDLAASANASGQLQPRQQSRLALTRAGRVERIEVNVGDRVQAGDVLVQLEIDDLERSVQAAEQNLAIQEANLAELRKAADAEDVAAAEAALANTQAQLDDLLAGPSREELAQAEAALASAQAQLADVLAGPSKEELAQAEAALVSTQSNLSAAHARTAALDDQRLAAQDSIDAAQHGIDAAQSAYDHLVWSDWKAGVSWAPYSPQGVALEKAQIVYGVAVANRNLTELEVNDSAVVNAQSQVAQAEANLVALTEGRTAQIAASRAQAVRAEKNLVLLTEDKTVQVATARAQLAQAQANLDKLLDGSTAGQIAAAQAGVEQARISLADAQAALEDAALFAPYDGLVTDVYVAIGEQAAGPVVELVNTDSLQVVLDVDEVDLGQVEVGQETVVDLGQVEVGQETVVTLEAWPGYRFAGTVASIAPQAKDQAGIVVYEVRLDVDWSSAGTGTETFFLTGMTADAELITARREDVLLVPNEAIGADRSAGVYRVRLVEDEDVREVEVTIGMRDRTHTEVTSRLREGDRLLTGIPEAEAKDAIPMRPGQGPGAEFLRGAS